jgi:hypothetical protein
MPYAMVPPGYRAVLLGQAASLDDLGTFAPLEEGTAEGALVLMRLDFAAFPTGDDAGRAGEKAPGGRRAYLAGLSLCRPCGCIPAFGLPGLAEGVCLAAGDHRHPGADGTAAAPRLDYLAHPAPELKDLINNLIGMGMMLLVMLVTMQVMKPLTAAMKEKPKELKEAKA